MSRTPPRKAKHTKPTREEILAGAGWEPGEYPDSMPQPLRKKLDREQQDYIVSWVQGLSAHIDQYKRLQEERAKKARGGRESDTVVDIDPGSDIGALMAKLRSKIDPHDLAGKGLEPHPHIVVRHIVDNDLNGLRTYLRSLLPFEISFGVTSALPSGVKGDKALVLVLKVDVISFGLDDMNRATEQHVNCKPTDFDVQPHAIVAYVKPGAVKKYVGNKLLAGRTMEVSTISIRPKDGEPESVRLIGAPAPWWAGYEVKSPKRKRTKSSPSRAGAKKPPRAGK